MTKKNPDEKYYFIMEKIDFENVGKNCGKDLGGRDLILVLPEAQSGSKSRSSGNTMQI